MANILKELERKNVIVYSMGVTYKGILIEANETEVYLRTQNGWVTIPMDRIAKIAPAPEERDFTGRVKKNRSFDR